MNDVMPVDQQKTGMDLTPVNAVRVMSSAEMAPKQQSANIAMVTQVSHAIVSLAPQPMDIDQKRVEAAGDMNGGNPIVHVAPAAGTVFPSVITSSLPVSTQNMAEGK